MPLTHKIPNYQPSCLLEKLDAEERITTSIFIASGAELRATVTIEGPVAPPDAKTGKEIDAYNKRYKNGERFGKIDKENLKEESINEGRGNRHMDRNGNLHYTEKLDFEHMADGVPEYIDDDHWFLDDELEDLDAILPQTRREERLEGDPWDKTFRVLSPGWYRACVMGTWYHIEAEIEFRKESELGWYDAVERVHTYDEARLNALNKDVDANAHLADEVKTKTQLKILNHLMAAIKEKQREDKRRLEVHAAINEHSHSRMVLGSLAETVLFIIVTGFQIFTIRKWFTSEPMLGK